MDSTVDAKVNVGRGLVREPHCGALQPRGGPRHGKHRAVMVAIRVDVEKPDP
jgi:hypothetical protein